MCPVISGLFFLTLLGPSEALTEPVFPELIHDPLIYHKPTSNFDELKLDVERVVTAEMTDNSVMT